MLNSTTIMPCPPVRAFGFGLVRALFLAIFLACAAVAAAFAAPNYPALTGRVVDAAGMLTADQRIMLENKLRDVETQTGHQVAVAIVSSLDGQDIAPYANELFRKWKLGDKTANDGVLLLVSSQDRKVRIEVGYGLEGDLTDAMSSIIISNAIVPKFKTGNYVTGLWNGVDDIAKVIKGNGAQVMKAAKPKQQQQSSFVQAIPFIIFILIAIIILSNASRGGVVFLPIPMNGGYRRDYGGGGFGGGFGGGGGFDGGGFGGGGGSSGGGGASGGW